MKNRLYSFFINAIIKSMRKKEGNYVEYTDKGK